MCLVSPAPRSLSEMFIFLRAGMGSALSVPPKLQKMFSDKSFCTGLHLVLHIAGSTRSFAEVNFTGKSGDAWKEGRVNIDKLNIEDKKPKGRTLETQFRFGKVCWFSKAEIMYMLMAFVVLSTRGADRTHKEPLVLYTSCVFVCTTL